MYLLDTHAVLWWLLDRSRLSQVARDTIENTRHVYLSAATTWEIAIKTASGKLQLPHDFKDKLDASRFEPLPVTATHTFGVMNLPPVHRDPFDRLLVAQAAIERLTLLTSDSEIQKYGVPVLAA